MEDLNTLIKRIESLRQDINQLKGEEFYSCNSYVKWYNQFRNEAIEIFGDEIKTKISEAVPFEFEYLDQSALINCKMRCNVIKVALGQLSVVLQGKLDVSDQAIIALVDYIKNKLRAAVFDVPTEERDIDEAVEILLLARNYEHNRSKVSIPYSSKSYIPDFTFEKLSLACDVKLCKKENREKEIIDEISADILAYKTKYENILFVVYDLGIIRDVAKFQEDIENNDPNVRVLVIKH
jgi:hypothetical protein